MAAIGLCLSCKMACAGSYVVDPNTPDVITGGHGDNGGYGGLTAFSIVSASSNNSTENYALGDAYIQLDRRWIWVGDDPTDLPTLVTPKLTVELKGEVKASITSEAAAANATLNFNSLWFPPVEFDQEAHDDILPPIELDMPVFDENGPIFDTSISKSAKVELDCTAFARGGTGGLVGTGTAKSGPNSIAIKSLILVPSE